MGNASDVEKSKRNAVRCVHARNILSHFVVVVGEERRGVICASVISVCLAVFWVGAAGDLMMKTVRACGKPEKILDLCLFLLLGTKWACRRRRRRRRGRRGGARRRVEREDGAGQSSCRQRRRDKQAWAAVGAERCVRRRGAWARGPPGGAGARGVDVVGVVGADVDGRVVVVVDDEDRDQGRSVGAAEGRGHHCCGGCR